MISQHLDTRRIQRIRLACHFSDEQTALKQREETPEINNNKAKIYQENNYDDYNTSQTENRNQLRKNTFPNDLLTLAWNARVGYSFDNILNHPFVAQAGTRSHVKAKTRKTNR